jgi:hypothetical protein
MSTHQARFVAERRERSRRLGINSPAPPFCWIKALTSQALFARPLLSIFSYRDQYRDRRPRD